MEQKLVEKLEKKAKIIRYNIIKMIGLAGSGHPGGALSSTEIITSLFFHIMNYDPKNPNWPDRDRFVLSKGHSCAALYAALAEAGFFPVETLWTFRKLNSILQGHPDKVKTPGVEISSGSLGQGLSVANGMALAAKLDKKNYHTFVLLGDGELDEGQIWEAATTSAHYKLDNLTAIIDRNKLQIDGPTEKVMSLGNLTEKFKSFGFYTLEIDGHNFGEILDALDKKNIIADKPKAVIASTIKGKGVSFMEGVIDFHGKATTKEETIDALEEIGLLDFQQSNPEGSEGSD